MDLHDALRHPLFQSVVLPLVLSSTGVGLLRAVSGYRHATAAIGLAVVLSAIWMAGWSSQPGSVMEKLPWAFAVAWLAGLVLDLTVRNRLVQWLGLTIVWLVISWWLGTRGAANGIAFALAGTALIAFMLRPPADRADAVTMAVVASLGLAGLAFSAGSLALFQFSLILAAALGGGALWLWPKARVHFGAAAVAVAAIGWLALAQATFVLLPARPQALAVLAAAFAAATVLGSHTARFRPVAAPLAVAAVSGLCVAAALALQELGATDGTPEEKGNGADDAYYSK